MIGKYTGQPWNSTVKNYFLNAFEEINASHCGRALYIYYLITEAIQMVIWFLIGARE